MPEIEHAFLIDQRTERKMCIGNVDAATSKVLENRIERRKQYKKAVETTSRQTKSSTSIDVVSTSRERHARPDFSAVSMGQNSTSDSDSSTSSEASITELSVLSQSSTSYNMMDVNNVAITADRYDVSDTATAAIVSAGFLDAGIVTKDNRILVVDRSKIRRARVALRTSSVESLQAEELHAFFFDGRKDLSLKNQFGRVRKVVQDHISMVREPRSLFLSHVTVDEGGARCLADTIWNRLLDKNIDTTTIKAIGCDGTNVNVGRKNGALRFLEMLTKDHVQWLVCLLHTNELPFRVLLLKYVGKTNDPHSFTGPLGAKLKTCQTMPIVAFERMEFGSELENINTAMLNTDKKYLFDICRVISTGVLPDKFEHRATGINNNLIIIIIPQSE